MKASAFRDVQILAIWDWRRPKNKGQIVSPRLSPNMLHALLRRPSRDSRDGTTSDNEKSRQTQKAEMPPSKEVVCPGTRSRSSSSSIAVIRGEIVLVCFFLFVLFVLLQDFIRVVCTSRGGCSRFVPPRDPGTEATRARQTKSATTPDLIADLSQINPSTSRSTTSYLRNRSRQTRRRSQWQSPARPHLRRGGGW